MRKCRICTRPFNFRLWRFKKYKFVLLFQIVNQMYTGKQFRLKRKIFQCYVFVDEMRGHMGMFGFSELLAWKCQLAMQCYWTFSVRQYQPSACFLLILYFSTFNFTTEVMLVQHGIHASIPEYFIFMPEGSDSVCLLLHQFYTFQILFQYSFILCYLVK